MLPNETSLSCPASRGPRRSATLEFPNDLTLVAAQRQLYIFIACLSIADSKCGYCLAPAPPVATVGLRLDSFRLCHTRAALAPHLSRKARGLVAPADHAGQHSHRCTSGSGGADHRQRPVGNLSSRHNQWGGARLHGRRHEVSAGHWLVISIRVAFHVPQVHQWGVPRLGVGPAGELSSAQWTDDVLHTDIGPSSSLGKRCWARSHCMCGQCL